MNRPINIILDIHQPLLNFARLMNHDLLMPSLNTGIVMEHLVCSLQDETDSQIQCDWLTHALLEDASKHWIDEDTDELNDTTVMQINHALTILQKELKKIFVSCGLYEQGRMQYQFKEFLNGTDIVLSFSGERSLSP